RRRPMRAREAARLLLALAFGIAIGASLTTLVAPSRVEAPAAPPTEADLERFKAFLGQFRGDAAPAKAIEPADYSAEVVMYDQPRLMDEAFGKLKRQTPGKTDLYLLAFAGDGDEDVFRNEVEYAEKLFSQRFGAAGRTLVLENNPATVGTRPLATWTNLEDALERLSTRVMDPEEDILVLFLTSHGSETHELYVGMGDLPLDAIGAGDLADILAAHPLRWKVVVVSACYSGGFVAPLKNATTMVIAAAREDRPSFGCGADSDITYFGNAFLAHGLNEADTFRGAFDVATRLVADWEAEHTEGEPSEPQIASTPLVEAKLAGWRQELKLGAPVPFAPADPPAHDAQAGSRSRNQ
ncbi:MAG TPA: C13 family peptidase, partial [Tahibacter sp.]|nr:C13 family peptidase [Tahibacter sp.]